MSYEKLAEYFSRCFDAICIVVSVMLTDYPWQLWLILYPVPDFGFFYIHQGSAMTKKVENFAKKEKIGNKKQRRAFQDTFSKWLQSFL